MVRWQGFSRKNNTAEPAPLATLTVKLVRQNILANLYLANDYAQPAPNPMTAGSDGFAFFYADNGRYDLTWSGGGIGGIQTPWSLGDVVLYDPGTISS